MPRVSICVPTYRRAHSLERLLSSLATLDNVNDTEIIVVENDNSAKCRSLVSGAASRVPGGNLKYVHIETPNVATARNVAIATATGDWIAFIDDDEVPSHDWLTAMLRTAEQHRADGVVGSILPSYPPGTPTWIIDCGVYRRRRFKTGTPVPTEDLRTGNLLLRRALFHALGTRFDDSLGSAGGEDSECLTKLAKAGADFVWCDEASVVEYLEPNRLETHAVALRAIAAGQSFAEQIFRRSGLPGYAQMAIKGIVGMSLRGTAGLLLLAVNRAEGARLLVRAAGDLGKLTAVAGVRYERFRNRWRWGALA